MNIKKAKQMIQDPSFKQDHARFLELKTLAKSLCDTIEANSHRSLIIFCKNGDTYNYTWNGSVHCFSCTHQHNNKLQTGYFSKTEAIEAIQIDLYQQAEYKLF